MAEVPKGGEQTDGATGAVLVNGFVILGTRPGDTEADRIEDQQILQDAIYELRRADRIKEAGSTQ